MRGGTTDISAVGHGGGGAGGAAGGSATYAGATHGEPVGNRPAVLEATCVLLCVRLSYFCLISVLSLCLPGLAWLGSACGCFYSMGASTGWVLLLVVCQLAAHTVLLHGAGGAGLGIADLLAEYISRESAGAVSLEQAR